jgi:hypothetical protein
MDSKPDAETPLDEKDRAENGKDRSKNDSPEPPSPADERAYEDAWYKVLKRRSQETAKEDED